MHTLFATGNQQGVQGTACDGHQFNLGLWCAALRHAGDKMDLVGGIRRVSIDFVGQHLHQVARGGNGQLDVLRKNVRGRQQQNGRLTVLAVGRQRPWQHLRRITVAKARGDRLREHAQQLGPPCAEPVPGTAGPPACLVKLLLAAPACRTVFCQADQSCHLNTR
ncbi:hypothetical protein D3C79_790050 [compost metagenome]